MNIQNRKLEKSRKTTALVEQTNTEYYDELYKSRSAVYYFLHSLISFDQQSKARRNYKVLKPHLKDQMTFLDYGFGFGTLLLKIPSKAKLYGCDISTQAINNMKQVARWTKRDVTLSTPEEFDAVCNGVVFDAICSSHVLEHAPDDFALLKTFHRHLHPSGILLINVPVHELADDPKHIREYTVESAHELLRLSGFRPEQTWETDRWTGFLTEQEQLKSRGKSALLAFRLLRLFLAILPFRVEQATEALLPKRYPNQQLLILARKAE